jgi:hypothetical protein
MSPPHTCSHGPPQSAGFHLPTPGSGRSGLQCADLSQIEKHLGSFTTNPESYVRVPVLGSIL